MAAFAFLFSELVQYSQAKVKNVNELEKRYARACLLLLLLLLQINK